MGGGGSAPNTNYQKDGKVWSTTGSGNRKHWRYDSGIVGHLASAPVCFYDIANTDEYCQPSCGNTDWDYSYANHMRSHSPKNDCPSGYAEVDSFLCSPSLYANELCYRILSAQEVVESVAGNGQNYRGSQSFTKNGKKCQKWTSQSPHKHTRTDQNYPNKGIGDHDYCRNPDGHTSIWCYTTDPNKRWENCSPCDETNKVTGNGENYRGCLSTTISGKTCQKWTSQSPHTHSRTSQNYPNKGVGDHNYCRNPDGHTSIWCYTTDPNKRWENCDMSRLRSINTTFNPIYMEGWFIILILFVLNVIFIIINIITYKNKYKTRTVESYKSVESVDNDAIVKY
eukprot:548080_1